MGAGGEDIKLSPAARRKLPLSFECKKRARFAIYTDYEQAKSNAPDGAEPVVVIEGNYKKPLAVVDLEYFIKLFRS